MTTLTLERPYKPDAEEIRRAVEARRSLLGFAQWVRSTYERAQHLELTASHLEAVERREINRLIIMEPPQHGKSTLGSVMFPAWSLCRQPTRRIITACYGDLLTNLFGRECRNVMASTAVSEIFPDISLAPDSKAANLWHTNKGGRFLATTIGGGITGHGADHLNIDDPIKSRAEAESTTYREWIWQWWKSDARTRVAADGAVVLTYTPRHQDDLGGRLLNSTGERWTVLRLSALAEADDPLNRAVGEPLWPERYPLEALEALRESVGPKEWEALYQQRPTPAEGATFKLGAWQCQYKELPTLDRILIPIDTAYSGEGDYWAWAAWGMVGRKTHLVNADRCRTETPEGERRVKLFYESIKSQFPNIRVTPLVRKSVAIDRVAGQHLRAIGLPVVDVKMPGKTKELANITCDRFESGMALIPEYANWLEPWLQEHLTFPSGEHDDWVETTVIMDRYLAQGPQPFNPSPVGFTY